MKYIGSVDIDKPRAEVVKFFADPKYLGQYQDGFIKKELIAGKQGMDGAVSNMLYKYGKGEMVLTETIIAYRLPDLFESKYHHMHMDNTMKCRFIELGYQKTRYEFEFEYTRINWFLPRIIAIFFPNMYRKQGEKWMKQFKEFVEKQ